MSEFHPGTAKWSICSWCFGVANSLLLQYFYVRRAWVRQPNQLSFSPLIVGLSCSGKEVSSLTAWRFRLHCGGSTGNPVGTGL